MVPLSPHHFIILPDTDEHSCLRYLKRISAIIGSNHIHSVFKNNGHIKIYFSDKKYVRKVMDSGVTLISDKPKVCRTDSTILKIIMSKVDPIIPDSVIANVLKLYGSLESSIVHIKVSENVQFAHIYSGTREVKIKVFDGILFPKTIQVFYNDVSYEIDINVVEKTQTAITSSAINEKKSGKNCKNHFLNSVNCDSLSFSSSIECLPESYKDDCTSHKNSRPQNVTDLLLQIHYSSKCIPVKNYSCYNKENFNNKAFANNLKFPVIQEEQFMAFNKKYISENVSKYVTDDKCKSSSKMQSLSSSNGYLPHKGISNQSNAADLCPVLRNSGHCKKNKLKLKKRLGKKSKSIRKNKSVAANSCVNTNITKVVNSVTGESKSSNRSYKAILAKKKKFSERRKIDKRSTKPISTSLINSTIAQLCMYDHNHKKSKSNMLDLNLEEQSVVPERDLRSKQQKHSDSHLNSTSVLVKNINTSLEIKPAPEEQIESCNEVLNYPLVICTEENTETYEENSACDLTTSSSLKSIVSPDSLVIPSKELVSNDINCSGDVVDSYLLKTQNDVPDNSLNLECISSTNNSTPLQNESVTNISLLTVNDHAVEKVNDVSSKLPVCKAVMEREIASQVLIDDNTNLSSKSISLQNEKIDEMDCNHDNRNSELVDSFECETQTIQKEIIKAKCNGSLSSELTFVPIVVEHVLNSSLQHEDHLSKTCNDASDKEHVCENNSDIKRFKEKSVDLNVDVHISPKITLLPNPTIVRSKSYSSKIGHKFYNHKVLKTQSVQRKVYRSKSSPPARNKNIPEYEFDFDDSDSNCISYNKWKHQKFFPKRYFKPNLSLNKRNLTSEDIDNIYCLSSDLTLDFNNPYAKNKKKKSKNIMKRKSTINSFEGKRNFANYFKSFPKTLSPESSKVISTVEKIGRKKHSTENIVDNMQREINMSHQQKRTVGDEDSINIISKCKKLKRSNESCAVDIESKSQNCKISNEKIADPFQKASKNKLEYLYCDTEKIISKPSNSEFPIKSSTSDFERCTLNVAVKENQLIRTYDDDASREHINRYIVQEIHDKKSKNSLNQTLDKKSMKSKHKLKSNCVKVTSKITDDKCISKIKYSNDKNKTVNNQKSPDKDLITEHADVPISVTLKKNQNKYSNINTNCSNLHYLVHESVDSTRSLALEQNNGSDEDDFHSCVNGFLQQLASCNQHNVENKQIPCKNVNGIMSEHERKNHLLHKLDIIDSRNSEKYSQFENEIVTPSFENTLNEEQLFVKNPSHDTSLKQDTVSINTSSHKELDSSMTISYNNVENFNDSNSVLLNIVSNHFVSLKKCSVILERLPEAINNKNVFENNIPLESDNSSLHDIQENEQRLVKESLIGKPCKILKKTKKCESINEELKSNGNVTSHNHVSDDVLNINDTEISDNMRTNNTHLRKEYSDYDVVLPSASFANVSNLTYNDRNIEIHRNIRLSESCQDSREHFKVTSPDFETENNVLIKCERNLTLSCSGTLHNSQCDNDRSNQFKHTFGTNIKQEFCESFPSYEMGSIYELDEQQDTHIFPSICNKINNSDFSSHNSSKSSIQGSEKNISSNVQDVEGVEIHDEVTINIKQEPIESLDFGNEITNESNISCNNNVLPILESHCFSAQGEISLGLDSFKDCANVKYVQNLSNVQNLAEVSNDDEQSCNRTYYTGLSTNIDTCVQEIVTSSNLTYSQDCQIPTISSVTCFDNLSSTINSESSIPEIAKRQLKRKSNNEFAVSGKIVLLQPNYNDDNAGIELGNPCTFQVINPIENNSSSSVSRLNCSNDKQDFPSNNSNTLKKIPFHFNKSNITIQPKIKSMLQNNIEKDVPICNSNVTSNFDNKIINVNRTPTLISSKTFNSLNFEEVNVSHCQNNSNNFEKFYGDHLGVKEKVQNNQNSIDLAKTACEMGATSTNESNMVASCVEGSNVTDDCEREKPSSTLNSVKTFVVKSVAVKPKYTDIYSVYKNISNLKKKKHPKSLMNFPLPKKKLIGFMNSVVNCRNPKQKALKILESNNTPGALKDLILQLYDFFKKCNDDKRRLQISHLIMLLNDRTTC
ncbi:uncharacterized protein NPIL_393621 [Nephila pilipes]|uniref:Uncharacterized protein n=1 Tax=Nephila pilipes TaxID=299642 RepID=A0A8X6N2P2_NEPPI|nr:uncharacterized protein NPIL_393621 [Nephila pilipes]